MAAAVAVAACGGGSSGDGGVRSGAIVVRNVVATEAIDGRAALYATLRNAGTAPDTLTAVTIPGVADASLHATGGGAVRRMAPVGFIALPAGQTVRLAPGGFHVMLEGASALAAGAVTDAQFTFRDGRTVRVPVRVVAYADLESVLDSLHP